ncbi:divalent-cation tolerance protein CutA [Jeongeupia chitinilytica]|uniref:Divalent-cation tolerance protein CutA n=1 Tax=Jeongeupia chitinilytica TaxID=1041641 RepID=A0ABQ3H3R2_9NEIS|nr:divalent-cation tolerance protein CutA [Jeongeupia chitinilytica]GHD65560.1 divalent-cation tolerance protein CutA [Jeongeupia chitinilytica]
MNTPDQSATSHCAVVVICNCPDAATADRLATGLLEARLAACVNRLAPVQSIYRWEGRIETAEEVPLLAKTTLAAFPALQLWLAERHPYEVPEIIALPVTAGLPAYLDWLNDEVLS